MEFTVTRENLVRELGLMAGVCASVTTLPVLSNVLLVAGGDVVLITATDMQSSLRSECSARVLHSGAVTVPAKRLLDYVRLLPDGDITITADERHWVSVVSGRSRARMGGMDSGAFPEVPEKADHMEAEIPFRQLSGAIAQTGFAVSNEESRFLLNGELLILSPDRALMVATDGHRLASHASDRTGQCTIKMLVPKRALAQLAKLAAVEPADAVVRISRDDTSLFFETDKRLLVTRELTGNFPDYERVLPKDAPHSVVVHRVELAAAIGRVAQFSDERTNMIKLRVAEGAISLQCGVAEVGESAEDIAVDYSGPPVEIGFAASYLLDFLRVVAEEKVEFRFKDSASAGELRPCADGGGRYRYVVMPMRV